MKIQKDKWRHFFAGIVMGAVLLSSLFYILEGTTLALVLTLVIVVVVSYGFELFSKWTGKGYYELMDAFATIIGGLIGMLMVFLGMKYF